MKQNIESNSCGEVLRPCHLQNLPEFWDVDHFLIWDLDDYIHIHELLILGSVLNVVIIIVMSGFISFGLVVE
jgi:hypothetical protein